MPGTRLECPSCGLTLTMPKPVSAGALLRCPKCQASFGVPVVENVVPIAAPAVARLAPTPVAVAVAVATNVTDPPRRIAGRIEQPHESSFPELETFSPAESTQLRHKDSERSSRRGQRLKANNARLMVLSAVGGLVIIGGLVAILVVTLGDANKPGSAKDGPDASRAAKPADSESAGSRVAKPGADKKEPVAAKSRNDSDKKKAVSAKKAKPADMDMDLDLDPSKPIPIPGVQTPLPMK